jgi:hypothetical protein
MLAIEAETVAGACDEGARDGEETEGAEAATCWGAALKPRLLSNRVRQTWA